MDFFAVSFVVDLIQCSFCLLTSRKPVQPNRDLWYCIPMILTIVWLASG